MERASSPISATRNIPALKIYLLSDYSGNVDEGMKKIASYYKEGLVRRHHQVSTKDVRAVLRPTSWRELRKAKPDIIHYVPGPSPISFLLTRFARMASPGAKAIMSATHPNFHGVFSLFTPLIRLLKSDLLLVQSTGTEQMLRRLGCKTAFLPSGVDMSRFSPVSDATRRQLREKYGLNQSKFVVLHTGHLNRTRNIEVLSRLQQGDRQVIVVASTTTRASADIRHRLEKSGCLVLTGYQPEVEELYQLADCYVFPTTDERGSVQMPLSVLEAMSCNLPVVTTRFGALPRFIEPEDGVIYIEHEDDMEKELNKIQTGSLEVRTRDKVVPYSWENIVARLEEIYLTLVQLPTEQ